MVKKPRLRAPNFTTNDNLLLCDIIAKHKKIIIENKKTDGATLLQKQQAWAKVVSEFNSCTTNHHRTVESLQQNYKNLKKKAKKNSSKLNAKMTVPGEEGSPPTTTKNDILDKVKHLVGPAMDGMYTIYDEDSGLIAVQDMMPIEFKNMETDNPSSGPFQDSNNRTNLKRKYESSSGPSQEDNVHIVGDTPFPDVFTNDGANLKKEPNSSLTCKEKLIFQKQTVANKFKALASVKIELVQLQKELLKVQLQEEIEKADHNRQIRAIQLEELKRVHEHNKILGEMELKTFKN